MTFGCGVEVEVGDYTELIVKSCSWVEFPIPPTLIVVQLFRLTVTKTNLDDFLWSSSKHCATNAPQGCGYLCGRVVVNSFPHD